MDMKERYEFMDYLRVFAIFAVVCVHVVSKVVGTEPYGEEAWHIGNVIDSGLRWCVPIFFMLSGALLLTSDKDESVGAFLKKRLAKVLIPLVIWSLIYLIYRSIELNEQFAISDVIRLILIDDVYYHLWFLYVIFGLYLMAPFLRILVKHMNQKMFMMFLLFWFAISGLLPFIPKYFGFEPALTAGLFQPYIGYFLLGAYLVLYPLPRKSLAILGVLSVIGYGITVWGTADLTLSKGELDEFYYEHYRPNQIFISVFVFVLFQQLDSRLKRSRLIEQLSLSTLGIYVIHPLVQTYLADFGIHERIGHPLFGIVFAWITIFIVSFAIVYLVRKIPVVSQIFP